MKNDGIGKLLHLGWVGLCILVGLILVVIVVAFLGGLASAALEVKRERAAGLEPTRPAWDNRRKRRAVGGLRERARVAWTHLEHRGGVVNCWCGQGPVVHFEALDDGSGNVAGYGCAAWEAGDPLAVLRHDEAGGYGRTPALREAGRR